MGNILCLTIYIAFKGQYIASYKEQYIKNKKRGLRRIPLRPVLVGNSQDKTSLRTQHFYTVEGVSSVQSRKILLLILRLRTNAQLFCHNHCIFMGKDRGTYVYSGCGVRSSSFNDGAVGGNVEVNTVDASDLTVFNGAGANKVARYESFNAHQSFTH